MVTTLSLDRRCSTKCNAGNKTRFQFLRLFVPDSKTHDILTYLSLFLDTKSFPDLFLNRGIITSPLFVDPLPVVFTVLSWVIPDVLLVLLAIGSLAAGCYQLLRRDLRISAFSVRYRFCWVRI